MSYTAPKRTRPAGRGASTARTKSARRTKGVTEPTDWEQVALFGAGLALGVLVGVGATLLSAPQSGRETRADIRSYATRKRHDIGRRGTEAWWQVRDELRNTLASLKHRKARRHLAQASAEEREAAELES